jgi:adenosine kinase
MDKYIDECKQEGIPYLYDPSQQIVRVEGDVLKNGIEGSSFLFVNEYEFGLVQKKTGMTEVDVLEQVELLVVTKGEKGSVVYHRDEVIEVAAVPPRQIIDPTGAGDAFRGGFLTGYSWGWDWQICSQMGALTATYCLESDGPQGHAYSREGYVARFRENYDDGGLLDKILEV